MDSNTLDSLDAIKSLDSQNMLGSINALAKQIAEVRALAKNFKLPNSYSKVKKVVFAGMGGSTLGSHIIQVAYKSVLKVPVEIVNNYHLPAYVDKDTLVVGVSYSGTTEEPLSALVEAKKKKAKICVVTSGGAMATWAKKNKIPAIVFTTDNNPCNSPRMGGGYMLTAQLILLNAAKLIKVTSTDFDTLEKSIESAKNNFGVANTKNNLTKQIALNAQNRSVWYIASGHLVGNAHVAANQMNENAKRFAGFFLIPELNHHLMEGLLNPTSNTDNVVFVLLESKSYDPKIQKRFSVTKEILNKNKIDFFSYEFNGPTPLAEIGEALSLSSHTSFYTAIQAGIDPTAIPFVDFFKEQLKK